MSVVGSELPFAAVCGSVALRMKFLKPNVAAPRFEQALINLQIRWSEQGVGVRPGATPGQIADFKKRHGVRLPDELRIVYSFFDGFVENSRGMMSYSSRGRSIESKDFAISRNRWTFPKLHVIDLSSPIGVSTPGCIQWK